MKGTIVLLLGLLVCGCGGGGSGSNNTNSVSVPNAAHLQWGWEFQLTSTADSNSGDVTPVTILETNLYETPAGALASTSGLFVLKAGQTTTGLVLTSAGSNCSPVGSLAEVQTSDYVAISQVNGSTQFEFYDQGNAGTLETTGSVTFSENASANTATGNYTTPAGCGYPADSGTITGTQIAPFSGTYSGELNDVPTTIALTTHAVGQNGPGEALNVTATGTYNDTAATGSGTQVGGALSVDIGDFGEFIGIYDPVENDFLGYAPEFNFVGYLYAGSNPEAQRSHHLVPN
ncbi:MAG: hypothetical protein WBQ34_17960 [Candidatus Acidiferrales bacterium]